MLTGVSFIFAISFFLVTFKIDKAIMDMHTECSLCRIEGKEGEEDCTFRPTLGIIPGGAIAAQLFMGMHWGSNR